MGILLNLSAVALRPVLQGACDAMGLGAGGAAVEAVTRKFADHFSDHSKNLTSALKRANDRAWRALELALAGDSFWERCKGTFARAEDKAFRDQVRTFLDGAALPEVALPDAAGGAGPGAESSADFRRRCLDELRAARRAGLLDGAREGAIDAGELSRRAGQFARFADPQGVLDAEWRGVEEAAAALPPESYAHLRQLLTLRPDRGPSLLAAAVRYFFSREVQGDEGLFRGIAVGKMERLGEAQERGFAALDGALAAHGREVEQLLDEVLAAVARTHAVALDLKDEQRRQGRQLDQMYEWVERFQQHYQLNKPLQHGVGVTIRNDREKQLVRQMIAKYRALPEAQQQQTPALLNGLGLLELAAGDAREAQQRFEQVAGRAPDGSAKAEAHHNAYRAALERGDFSAAVEQLRQALAHDPGRYAPFPLEKYELVSVLGAGGFGVTFLCRDRRTSGNVAIKALAEDSLDRDLKTVFAEAGTLDQVNHPAIVKLRDLGYAREPSRSGPYVAMEYCAGETVEGHVKRHGPLGAAALRPIAATVADALRAAHAKGLLHRDVKPANIIVSQDEGQWRVKLIDFGLAVRHGDAAASATTATPAPAAPTGTSSGGIAGTFEYAAPEQMGRLPGTAVGPYSDVYGFGRTCYFALLGTPEPDDAEKEGLPEQWRRLLGRCTARKPENRFADFKAVLAELGGPPAPGPATGAPAARARPPLPGTSPVAGPPPVPAAAAPPPDLKGILVGMFIAVAGALFVTFFGVLALLGGNLSSGNGLVVPLSFVQNLWGGYALLEISRRRRYWVGLSGGGAVLLSWVWLALSTVPFGLTFMGLLVSVPVGIRALVLLLDPRVRATFQDQWRPPGSLGAVVGAIDPFVKRLRRDRKFFRVVASAAGVLALVIVAGLYLGSGAGKEVAAKLPGTWVLEEGPNKGQTYQFTPGGKLLCAERDGRYTVLNGKTIEVDGGMFYKSKLDVEFTSPDELIVVRAGDGYAYSSLTGKLRRVAGK